MRIFISLLCTLLIQPLWASDEPLMRELFKKYDLIMNQKKVEFIDEVFTQKFIKDSGGKKELSDKILELPLRPQKSLAIGGVSFKKGVKGDLYFARRKSSTSEKSLSSESSSEFIIIKENGDFKIDGTISDPD
jgi:hypothetical protein